MVPGLTVQCMPAPYSASRYPRVTEVFDPKVFLKTLTSSPGVYRMLDQHGRILYVGKARSLKKRVSSYYRGSDGLESKTLALMSHTARIEITATHTETEALLLENNLIKAHQPRYNILLRDDKSFPYIHLSTDQKFPRLSFHRGVRGRAGRYYGPYASAGATRETLNQLQKLFRVRQCQDAFFANRSRSCLQHQIKRCTAPCVGLVSESDYAGDVRHARMFLEGKSDEMNLELADRMDRASQNLDYEMAARYRDQIQSLRRVQERQYISGTRGNVDVIAACCKEGIGVVEIIVIRNGQSLGSRTVSPRQGVSVTAAQLLAAFLPQYYLASNLKRPLPAEILVNEDFDDRPLLAQVFSEQAGHKVSIRHRVRSARARWLEMAGNNAELAISQKIANQSTHNDRLQEFQEILDLPELPQRIECFDISHTGGEATVASCVVFDKNGPLKSDYRRFNIRDVRAGDDYAAIRQALTRRYTRLKKEDSKLPDVLLVDGGKGQLTQAREVLSELQIEDLEVLAVAKGSARKPGLETLYLASQNRPMVLDEGSRALALIQQIRDEAHRFAITGHRARRGKARKTSPLEHIPGVGPKRRRTLLREFGGLQGVARAGVEDLSRVSGINKTLAQVIYERFREHG